MSQSKYPHLFSPIQIRGKTFKNRILLAPMGIDESGPPGVMSQATVDFYERVAAGGAARKTTWNSAAPWRGITGTLSNSPRRSCF